MVFNRGCSNYPTSSLSVQRKETANSQDFADISECPPTGRIIAIDPGTKRIGVAVSDETRTIATPLERIERTSWKKLLLKLKDIIAEYDAATVVIGLPYNTDGSESAMSSEARDIARKLSISIDIPVFLQDERVTSYDAKGRLWTQGVDLESSRKLVDSEAATIILSDFLARL